MSVKKRYSSEYLHIVLSPKECPSHEPLLKYLTSKRRSCLSYIISYEYGKTGHKHIDAFFQMPALTRPDNFKSNTLSKLYSDLKALPLQWKNVHSTIHFIEPNPLYGFGYSLKEKPEVYYTNCDQQYLEKAVAFYEANNARVEEAIAVLANKKYTSTITLDKVFEDYLSYLQIRLGKKSYIDAENILFDQFTDRDGRERDFNKMFHDFYSHLSYRIPHSVYSKINQKKMSAHVQQELLRMHNNKG